MTTATTGNVLETPSFTLRGFTLSVTGDFTRAVAVVGTGSGEVHYTNTTNPSASINFGFNVMVSVRSDGTLIVGTTIDPGSLGLSGTNGELYIATKDVVGFAPKTEFPTLAANLSAGAFDLKAGVDFRLQYAMSSQVGNILSMINLPVPSAVQATGTLSTDGLSLTLGLDFSQSKPQIFTKGQTTLSLIGLNVSLSVGTTNSIGFSGQGILNAAPLYAGATASTVKVTVNGSYNFTTQTISLGFGLAAANCTTSPCQWTDALGIPGLKVGVLAVQLGLNLASGVPVPTISITASNVVLPTDWGNAIGISANASLTLDFAVNPTQTFVHVGIVGAPLAGGGHDIALRPLTLAKYAGASQQTIDSFTVSQADLFLAPLGGTAASGESISPGLSVKFDGKIVDTPIHVSAAVALTPTPRIDANIHFAALQLGAVRIADTYLDLHAGTDGFSFQFTGGFSDRGITFRLPSP